jgi:MFS family permease
MAFGLSGLALLALLTVVELRVDEPMLDLRLFKNKLFAAANAVQLVGFGAMQGALFLLPLFLQSEQGLSPLQSGLTTFPQAIGVMMMVRPAEKVYRAIGPRRMMMAGMLGISLTTGMFVWVGLATDQWWIRGIMLLRGWSFAFTLIPLQTATFATVRLEDTGRASAIFNSGRQIAASFGVALLGTVLTNRMTHHGAQLGNPLTLDPAVTSFHEAFLVASALGILGLVMSLVIDDHEAAGTMAVRPVDETASAADAVPAAVH